MPKTTDPSRRQRTLAYTRNGRRGAGCRKQPPIPLGRRPRGICTGGCSAMCGAGSGRCRCRAGSGAWTGINSFWLHKKSCREHCRPKRRAARSINVCERTDEPWPLPAEVMCRSSIKTHGIRGSARVYCDRATAKMEIPAKKRRLSEILSGTTDLRRHWSGYVIRS